MLKTLFGHVASSKARKTLSILTLKLHLHIIQTENIRHTNNGECNANKVNLLTLAKAEKMSNPKVNK